MSERRTSARTGILTPRHPRCRLCHYSGFSNYCDFARTSKCALDPALSEIREAERQRGENRRGEPG